MERKQLTTNEKDSQMNSKPFSTAITNPNQPRAIAAIGLLIIFLLGLIHTVLYKHYQPDDAFIYLVYAKNFLDGHGLTFNGALVEGYSSVLWTVLVTAISWFGMDPLMAAKALGWSAYLALALLLAWIHRGVTDKLYAPLFSISIYFAAPSIAMWASGAMEAVLFSMFLAAAAFTYFYARLITPSNRLYLISGVLFGLVSLTRPEGFALVGSVLAFELILFLHHRKWELTGAAITCFTWATITAAMFIGRWVIYDQWFPTTVGAKTGNLSWQMQLGSAYIIDFLKHHYVLIVVYAGSLAYAAARIRKSNPNQYFLVWFLTILVFGYIAFNWLVGGDWMLGWRFITPIIPFIALTIGITLGKINSRISPLILAAVVISLLTQTIELHTLSSKQVESDKGDILMGQYIQSLNLSPSTQIAVIDAGAIPYYAGLPTIDMIGLNDSYLSKLPGGFLQKYDNDYVLAQKPEIIQFHTKYINDKGDVAPTEAFRGSLVLFYTQEFQRWYMRDTKSPVPHLFVRREKALDHTFLDTYFDADLTARKKLPEQIEVTLRKTGDGIWLNQSSQHLEGGGVYIKATTLMNDGKIVSESLTPIDNPMIKGDEFTTIINIPKHKEWTRTILCPTLLGVQDYGLCAQNGGIQISNNRPSQPIKLGKPVAHNDNSLLFLGWSFPETNHTWSLGKNSTISFYHDGPSMNVVASMDISPQGDQKLLMYANDLNIYEGSINSPSTLTTKVFELKSGINAIHIEHPDAGQPSPNDPRHISIAFKFITITPSNK